MENFTAYHPTILHFGKNVLSALVPSIKEYGEKVLLIYGKESVKKTGLYQRIMKMLEDASLRVCEYGGIRSNPVIGDVEAAARTGRDNQVDVVLAVGGGSVIDSAKAIALTIPVDHAAWDFFTLERTPRKCVPVITILTLAATGSETNAVAVISNHEMQVKSPIRSLLAFPKHAFLDPELTYTVPRNYTAFGIADLIAHCMEVWFGAGDCSLSDRIIVSIIREAMISGPPLLDDPFNYDLRAKIMYAANLALNGLTTQGKVSGDWGVHLAGHVLSLLYDIPHGASLTIVYPAWLKFFKEPLAYRIALLGSEMFHKTLSTDQAIHEIENFFQSIDCPTRLSEMSIPGDLKQAVYEAMVIGKVNGANMKFKESDYPDFIDLFL